MRHNELTVASSIRLSGNESLQVEKATVGTSLKLIDDIGLEVNVEGTGDMFSSRSFGEKGPEPVVAGRGGAFHQTTIRLAKGFVRKKISSGFGNIVLTLREKVACSSGRVGRVGGDRKGPSSWGPFVAVGNVVVGELVVGGTSWTPACSCPPASPDYEGDCEVCLSMGPSLKGVSVMELAVWSTVSYKCHIPARRPVGKFKLRIRPSARPPSITSLSNPTRPLNSWGRPASAPTIPTQALSTWVSPALPPRLALSVVSLLPILHLF